MASVGLANNLAALRAMAVEGIQKGHMGLHGRNIALAAGVPEELVAETVKFMKAQGRVSAASAREYMIAHNIFSTLRRDYQFRTVERNRLVCKRCVKGDGVACNCIGNGLAQAVVAMIEVAIFNIGGER